MYVNDLIQQPTSSDASGDKKEGSPKSHKCQIVCPSYDFLSKTRIITDVVCSVPNCDEIFSHESAMKLHMEKVHKLHQHSEIDPIVVTKAKSKQQKLSDNCTCKYYCPVENCKFSLDQIEKSLPTFHSLKNHFIRIHGNKEHCCLVCNKGFSIKSEKERHEFK